VTEQGVHPALMRHVQRRAARVATVSVLLGDRSAALAAWTAHIDPRRAVIPCRDENAPGLARAYVTDGGVRAGLRHAIERRAARALQLAPRELGARLHAQTAFERLMFLNARRRALARTGEITCVSPRPLGKGPPRPPLRGQR
jgi:hypothetical protein